MQPALQNLLGLQRVIRFFHGALQFVIQHTTAM